MWIGCDCKSHTHLHTDTYTYNSIKIKFFPRTIITEATRNNCHCCSCGNVNDRTKYRTIVLRCTLSTVCICVTIYISKVRYLSIHYFNCMCSYSVYNAKVRKAKRKRMNEWKEWKIPYQIAKKNYNKMGKSKAEYRYTI